MTYSNSRPLPLDFQGENHQGKNFQESFKDKDLINAQFQGANLQEANFQGVDLYGAEFQGADLRNANLQSATLRGAKLQGADLRDANLQSADLHESSFKRAKLHGANLKECKDFQIANWTNAEYNSQTKFPYGFDPDEHGLIKTRRKGQSATKNFRDQPIDVTITNIQNAFLEIRKSLQKRQGQEKFRQDLIRCYQGRCAITGCTLEGVLEAAHVKPYCISKENLSGNGILLRADFHTLFDLNLIVIHPGSKKIQIREPLLSNTYYRDFNHIILPSYEQGIYSPLENYLIWRYENYEEHIGKFLREKF